MPRPPRGIGSRARTRGPSPHVLWRARFSSLRPAWLSILSRWPIPRFTGPPGPDHSWKGKPNLLFGGRTNRYSN
ncbi:hypothetical protein EBESD8_33140 [Rhodococcus aetherivorans]|nr:hypothetical protein EBESD8_33140 [Rhodococcus aetherivorans]